MLGATLFVTSTTSAGVIPRTHDGQYLHIATGFGWVWTSATLDADEIDLSGLTFDGEFSLGSTLRENFALYGTLFNWSAINPKIMGEGSNTTITHTGIAVGGTYYFMPSNIYASARVGGGWMRQQRAFGGSDNAAKTNFGFSGGVGVGKEWWVSDNWGVGFSGRVDFHSLPSADFDGTFNGRSFAIRFSATYN